MFYSHWLFDEQLDSNNVFFLHKYVKNCRKMYTRRNPACFEDCSPLFLDYNRMNLECLFPKF